jgi:hypothetical protein
MIPVDPAALTITVIILAGLGLLALGMGLVEP